MFDLLKPKTVSGYRIEVGPCCCRRLRIRMRFATCLVFEEKKFGSLLSDVQFLYKYTIPFDVILDQIIEQ